jgi:hypothetical protein
MSKPTTEFGEYFNLPNPGLRVYFDRVVKGQPDEYRTPFYTGKSLPSLVEEWTKKLDPLRKDWPSLFDFEIDLGKKVGPMSVMKPLKERMDDIDSYYDSVLPESDPIRGDAINAVLREWAQVSGLRLRSELHTVEVMKKSTNSGSPYFTKRRNVLAKTLPCEVLVNGLNVEQFLDDKFYRACAVLGWRGQEGGPDLADVKQRVVWMFPFAVNIQELRLYQPLIDAAKRFELVPAWVGMDAVDRMITRMFDTKHKDDLIVATDFSKFDQHFNVNLQMAAHQILESLMANDKAAKNWLNSVFPIKYVIPLAYDMGKMKTGRHGMGSGSGGTNADETVVHRALQYEAALLSGARLNPYSQCLGDDGVLTFPGVTVDKVVKSYTAHGLVMNTDKQYASQHDCTYLRRWHHDQYRIGGVCVGVYSTLRALGRLAEQERYYDSETWSREMVALRQLSILENVKWHPLNEEFVTWCMKGDKYRLGLDIPGFMDNISKIAQKAIELMPDFLGYTKSLQQEGRACKETGIADWWIVRYLKSLR